jgi:hypothetical protein
MRPSSGSIHKLVAWLNVQPRGWKQNVPPNRRLTSAGPRRNLSLFFYFSVVHPLGVINNLFQRLGHHLFSASVTEFD